MLNYRKKPLIVSAMQWNGQADNHALSEFCGHWVSIGTDVVITTSEGAMTVSPGDYIIKGIKGEFYPCKPDIFEATYDSV